VTLKIELFPVWILFLDCS